MRVLVPLDDSPPAWDALEYALEQFPEAEVIALTVLDPVESLLSGGDPYAQDPADRAEQEAEAIAEEAEDVAEVFEADLRTERVRGDPDEEIVTYAEEHEVDQIVMGSHGRDGISRILLGSTAERVVRRSPVPVTVVR